MENNVLDYLERTALELPEKIAFKCSDSDLITFKSLYNIIKFLGSRLISRQFDHESCICVICKQNIESIAAFLSAAYAGMYYVPIDGTLPKDRIVQLLNKAHPVLVIDCADIEAIEGYNWSKADFTEYEILPRVEVSTDAPLYGIFTSGSTGTPKLVLKSHRALISFINCYTKLFNFEKDEIIANQIPFYFDASTKDIFTVLSIGCTAIILDRQLFAQPGKLADALTNEDVTSIVWVPSALIMLSRFNVFSKYSFPKLRRVQFVGEQMPPKQLEIWMKALPNVSFSNLYGATENAGNCLYYPVSSLPTEDRIPVGYAFPNVEVFLLSETGDKISKNSSDSGEICITGDTLAIGYVDDDEKTHERFTLIDGKRTYRTGDIGRYNEDGALVCIGRQDNQIKLQGYRIELSDIEAAAEKNEGIERACALFDEKKSRILLIFSGKDDVNSIVSFLKTQLPSYMIPSKYIYKSELPLNQNGKINRNALKAEYIE